MKQDRIALRKDVVNALELIGKNIRATEDKLIAMDSKIKKLKEKNMQSAASANAATGAFEDISLLHSQQYFGNIVFVVLIVGVCFGYYKREVVQTWMV